jgi:hypothetical protein
MSDAIEISPDKLALGRRSPPSEGVRAAGRRRGRPRGAPMPAARRVAVRPREQYGRGQSHHTRKGANVPPTAVADPETTDTSIEDDATVGGFDENPEVARHEKLAEEKDERADELVEEGDDEGAQILRIEADEERSKAAQLKENAGAATGEGDPAAEAAARAVADAEAADLPPEEIIVSGVKMPYGKLGGKTPTGGTLSFSGGKIELEQGTAYKKGQTIRGTFVAVVKEVAQVDTHDSATQQVTSAEQRHVARFIDLTVEVPAE